MNTLAKPVPWTTVASLVLGTVVALIVFLTITGRRIPVLSSERGAFFTIAALGFLMCTIGLRSTGSRADFSWLNPFTITAVLLGILAIILVILVIIGRPLPMLSGDRGALIAMAIIIFSKWALANVHRLVSN